MYHRYKSAATVRSLLKQADEVTRIFHELVVEPGSLAGEFRDSTLLSRRFALCMRAIQAQTGLILHREQIAAGLALLSGKLVEMATGEGKTLSVVGPAAILSQKGEGVHVISANSYLAARDAQALAPIYELLGLSVGVVLPGDAPEDKRKAYNSDITYGVHSEFGFDRLRDERVSNRIDRVQRALAHAIVDEADAVLLDDARTPLILSAAPASATPGLVEAANAFVLSLDLSSDLILDPVLMSASLDDSGYQKLEAWMVFNKLIGSAEEMYSEAQEGLMQAVLAAVKAHGLYRRNDHYLVQGDEVVIIDEATGRLSSGRRWGSGIHEALEAKEGLPIRSGSVTTNRITYQSFFRLYPHLCGLTGTAMSDAEELAETYGLPVTVIPRHQGLKRKDLSDRIYATSAERWQAVVLEAERAHRTGQPVLIGTRSVEDAEYVGALLAAKGLKYQALTARDAAYEADRIAEAGKPSMITVATAVAGRGTDILLGGIKPVEGDTSTVQAWEADRRKVLRAGGLLVIGCDRSASCRVDDQLKGRCARQGDPGTSVFLLSIEDDLFRNRYLQLRSLFRHLDGRPLEGKAAMKLVRSAQAFAQANAADGRRQMRTFETIERAQRQAFLAAREQVLHEDFDPRSLLIPAARDWLIALGQQCGLDEQGKTRLGEARAIFKQHGLASIPLVHWVVGEKLELDEIADRAAEEVKALIEHEVSALTPNVVRLQLLNIMDQVWSDHLERMESLQWVSKSYARINVNPLYHFTGSSSEAFESAMAAVPNRWLSAHLSKGNHPEADRQGVDPLKEAMAQRWILRTAECPCGSGKRFKHCHGQGIQSPRWAAPVVVAT